MEAIERELDLLERISCQADSVHQRDLARIVGMSLGMTNAIVKRLVQKGWLTIRKVNNRNVVYAVSPEGIEQISRRSFRYLKRTIKNIVCYRDAIETFVRGVSAHGYRGLVLVGTSDLDFIVEHACGVSRMEYVRDDRKIEAAGGDRSWLFVLYSENYIPDEEEKSTWPNVAFLQEIVGAAQSVVKA
jgi:DNA-binding MarR family transcriptional regulator